MGWTHRVLRMDLNAAFAIADALLARGTVFNPLFHGQINLFGR